DKLNFAKDAKCFEYVIDAIRAIRNRRNEMNVPPSKKAEIFIETEFETEFKNSIMFFEKLASAEKVEIGTGFKTEGSVLVVTDSAKIYIPMAQLVDAQKEIARLTKEKAICEKDFNMINGKLLNQGFLAKAPENVIKGEKQKLEILKEKLVKIQESIESYN
ncbi:MAG: valine--tRNA ligase, partial [Clostridia bacterium]